VGFLSAIVLLMYASYIRGPHEKPALLKFLSTIVTLAILIDFFISIVVCLFMPNLK